MRSNPVKKKLQNGEFAIGTMAFEFNSSGLGRLAATAGAEFVIFDMEHTGWSIETIRLLVATTRSANIVPMVRVPATDYHFFSRTLDVGAMGLMVPMVSTAQQAQVIVNSAKYPPIGQRGAAFGVAHDDYASGDILAKMKTANDNVMLIAQIETVEGLENLESIAEVDGIDVLWVGHFDLTNSMGIPGQFDHPKYLSALDQVSDVARATGKSAGFMATTVNEGRSMLERGFRSLAYGGDLWLYQKALAEGITQLRQNQNL